MSAEGWQCQAVIGEAEDLDLIQMLRDGNYGALTLLFVKHSGIVFSIARRMLPNDAEAEQVVQQVFRRLSVFYIARFEAPNEKTEMRA